MAKRPNQKESPDDEKRVTLLERLRNLPLAIHSWISGSRLRMALASTLALITVGSTFALWSYLAHLAVEPINLVTLEMALAALDAEDTNKAKNLIGELQQQTTNTESLGGALFVLGAAKEFDAIKEWSADRRQAMHLVASRYLKKAQQIGIPPKRESQLLFLLGRSLVLGNQPIAGIPVLEEALLNKESWTSEIHSLLADANLLLPTPDLKEALKYNELLLTQPALDPEIRSQALITKAEILGKLGRTIQSRETLEHIQETHRKQARVRLLLGNLALLEASNMQPGSTEQTEKLATALSNLKEVQQIDQHHGELSRHAMYWIGTCYEAQGNKLKAEKQYSRLRKIHGDTPAGLAATLAMADLDRDNNRTQKAFAGYRTVLQSVGDPGTYSSSLLPLKILRKRLLRSYRTYVTRNKFEHAMSLVDLIEPVFSVVDVIELRAKTHRKWAEHKQLEGNIKASRQAKSPVWESRLHYRSAGRAYENVARLRFATRQFSEDLWLAAENYFLGHNYTNTIRTLEEYLYYESRRRNALALLRMGQSNLALGNLSKAIEQLNDCIELYPRDPNIFQARLECARSYLENGQANLAGQLLQTNLSGGTLDPTASEWEDSLFTLGHLLYNEERYHEAIRKLSEAVQRYPQAKEAMLARYLIARAFHSASMIPQKNMESANTDSDRQKNRQLYMDYLAQALDNYLSVKRSITLGDHKNNDPLNRNLLRNCYMMQGSVLFQLRRYEEARKTYANVTTLYQQEAFVLESFVQIANCWQRLNEPVKARGTIEQAKLVLERLPADTDFKLATNLNRQGWELLLEQLGKW
jgi:tetratricopeptide (TPR) repeat protein